MVFGGPYTTKIRYSDGKEETVVTPVTFEVGSVVAVVHKKDGSVIVTLAE